MGDLQWDHIVPTVHGGTDDPQNIQPSHAACNAFKNSQPLALARKRIHSHLRDKARREGLGHSELCDAVYALGGPRAVTRLLGVSQQTVRAWMKGRPCREARFGLELARVTYYRLGLHPLDLAWRIAGLGPHPTATGLTAENFRREEGRRLAGLD